MNKFNSLFYCNFYSDLYNANIRSDFLAKKHFLRYGKKEKRIINELQLHKLNINYTKKLKHYKYLDEIVDKIYLINLNKDTNRLNSCLTNSDIFCFKFERIAGVNPDNIKYKKEYDIWKSNNIPKVNFNNFDFNHYIEKYEDLNDLRKLTNKSKKNISWNHWNNYGKKEGRTLSKKTKISFKGTWGCLYSHINVLKLAIKNKLKNVLILEDDFMPHIRLNELTKKLENIMKNNNWKVIYLGTSQYKWDKISIQNNFYYANESFGTFAYIINNNFFNELLNEYKKFDDGADQILKKLQVKYPRDFLVIYPNLIISNLDLKSNTNTRLSSDLYHSFKWNKYYYNYFEFKNNNSKFINLIKNKRIVIVGPADYVNNGKLIDSYDIVIRINRGHRMTKNTKKYGSRTDILYHCVNQGFEYGGKLLNDDIKNIKHIRFCYPIIFNNEDNSFYHRASYFDYINLNLENINKSDKYSIISKKKYLDFENKLKTRPNSGTLAIWDLLHYEIKELYITGFTLFKTNYDKLYRDKVFGKSKNTGQSALDEMKKYGTHDQDKIKSYYKEKLLNNNKIKLDKIFIDILNK